MKNLVIFFFFLSCLVPTYSNAQCGTTISENLTGTNTGIAFIAAISPPDPNTATFTTINPPGFPIISENVIISAKAFGGTAKMDISLTAGANGGLGVIGGASGHHIDYSDADPTRSEFMVFTFQPDADNTGLATDVNLSWEAPGGSGFAPVTNGVVEAFDAGGASLGIQNFDIGAGAMDVSMLYGEAPIQSFQISVLSNTPMLVTGLSYQMQCASMASIPALSEWGIFLYFLTILVLGLVGFLNAASVYSLQNGYTSKVISSNKKISLGNSLQIPFDKKGYILAIKTTLMIVPFGFAFIYFVWGEIIVDDLIGMIFTIPLVGYLIYLMSDNETMN